MTHQITLIISALLLILTSCSSTNFSNFQKQKFTELSFKKSDKKVQLSSSDRCNSNSLEISKNELDSSLYGLKAKSDSILNAKTEISGLSLINTEKKSGNNKVVPVGSDYNELLLDECKSPDFEFRHHANNKSKMIYPSERSRTTGSVFLGIGIISFVLIFIGFFFFPVDVFFAVVIPLFFVSTIIGLILLIRYANEKRFVDPGEKTKNDKEPKKSKTSVLKKILLWSTVSFFGSVTLGVLSWKYTWQIDFIMEILAFLSLIMIFFCLIALLINLNK